jgi:glycosyltransferase involved in cell wall biosynthesis
VEAWHYYPDMAKPWIKPAIAATVDICVRHRPDAIWATAGPISSWIVAQQASERTGVPYVLDLRDPWGLNYYESELRRPRQIKQLDHRNMSRVLKGAQAVVFLFDSVAECYRRAYPDALDPAKIHIIPNGYDGTIDMCRRPTADRCLILYTGTLCSYRYDTLLQAVRLLKQSDAELARRLHLVFLGEGTEVLANEASSFNLSDVVTTRPPMSYAEIEQLQEGAHAFLVLGRPSTRKDYQLLAGAKLFAYLKTGQPIVGILPLDETRKVLQRVGVVTVADVDSPVQIVEVLRRILDAWSSNTLRALAPDRIACTAYSAECQTAGLICALEAMPAAEPFALRSAQVPATI